MINIRLEESFDDLDLTGTSELELLEHAARLTLERIPPESEVELSIVLTGEEKIHNLNREFRDVDRVTDVLSFPGGDTDPDTGNLYLGDVVICFPQAARQAKEYNHKLEDELVLLVVHGTLHLLGYDHASAEEKDNMQAVQNDVLNELGIKSNNRLE